MASVSAAAIPKRSSLLLLAGSLLSQPSSSFSYPRVMYKVIEELIYPYSTSIKQRRGLLPVTACGMMHRRGPSRERRAAQLRRPSTQSHHPRRLVLGRGVLLHPQGRAHGGSYAQHVYDGGCVDSLDSCDLTRDRAYHRCLLSCSLVTLLLLLADLFPCSLALAVALMAYCCRRVPPPLCCCITIGIVEEVSGTGFDILLGLEWSSTSGTSSSTTLPYWHAIYGGYGYATGRAPPSVPS